MHLISTDQAICSGQIRAPTREVPSVQALAPQTSTGTSHFGRLARLWMRRPEADRRPGVRGLVDPASSPSENSPAAPLVLARESDT